MIDILIGKEIYDSSQMKIKENRKYKFILNYSSLQIFKIKTLKVKEIEEYIEKEIFNSYDKNEILLDYKKDRKNKETIIFMYKINEVIRGLTSGRYKYKIIPIELEICRLIDKSEEAVIAINNRYMTFKIENGILKEVIKMSKEENPKNKKIYKYDIEEKSIKEVSYEEI